MNLFERLFGYKGARRTIWVMADGRHVPIGTMSRGHLVNALAMIMNKPLEMDEPNLVWRHTGVRGLRWTWPDLFVKEMMDRRKFRSDRRAVDPETTAPSTERRLAERRKPAWADGGCRRKYWLAC